VVQGVISGSLDEIWAASSDQAGVSRAEFDDYFAGSEKGVALRLGSVQRGKPISIATMQTIRPGFHPPQTIARISAAVSEALDQMSFGSSV
jgi:predicted transcriptional regulator